MRLWPVSLFCLLPAVALADAPRAEPAEPGIIDEDRRAEFLAVGRFQRGSAETASFCSGVLVAPDIVLTAAHCAGAPPDGSEADFVFMAGWDRGSYAAQRRIDRVVRHPFYLLNRGTHFRHDLALLHLSEPIEDIAPLPTARPDPEDPAFAFAGYSHARPDVLNGDLACPRHAAASNLLVVGCRVTSGHSGAPLLSRRDEGWVVTGVLVARQGDRAAIAVEVNGWVIDMVRNFDDILDR